MLSPTTPIITPPRVPLVDPRTGLIDRAWYLFFLSLNRVAAAVIDDSGLTFSAESVVASVEAELQTLAQALETQPSVDGLLSQIAELQKQVQALQLQPAKLLDQIAELQKQVQALQLTPLPAFDFGTMAFENIGISGTAALAKLTALGTDGSLTFTDGIITAYVAPT
jgi:hypothetical protein